MKLLEDVKLNLLVDRETAFFASLLLSLDVHYDDTIPTACTNGKYIKVNQPWFASLSKSQRIFLMLHEILHTVYMHPFRIGDRDHKRWNQACDYAINYYLVYTCGYSFIQGGLLDTQYKGMTAEAIYDLLPEDSDPDNVLEGDLSPAEGTEPEIAQQVVEVTDAIIQATMHAENMNKQSAKQYGNMPGDVLRQMDKLLNPVLPWEVLLANYATDKSNEDYSWQKRNKRFPDMIVPSLYSERISTVSVYVDASCSVTEEEFIRYISEIVSIKDTLDPQTLEVISFDTQIQTIQTCEHGEELDIRLKGYGGTRLTEVAERINTNEAEVIILFTDGYYNPVVYDKEVLHVIVGNPDYINEDHPVIHIT